MWNCFFRPLSRFRKTDRPQNDWASNFWFQNLVSGVGEVWVWGVLGLGFELLVQNFETQCTLRQKLRKLPEVKTWRRLGFEVLTCPNPTRFKISKPNPTQIQKCETQSNPDSKLRSPIRPDLKFRKSFEFLGLGLQREGLAPVVSKLFWDWVSRIW